MQLWVKFWSVNRLWMSRKKGNNKQMMSRQASVPGIYTPTEWCHFSSSLPMLELTYPTASISLWFSLLLLASEQAANSQISQNSLSSIAWRWKWSQGPTRGSGKQQHLLSSSNSRLFRAYSIAGTIWWDSQSLINGESFEFLLSAKQSRAEGYHLTTTTPKSN